MSLFSRAHFANRIRCTIRRVMLGLLVLWGTFAPARLADGATITECQQWLRGGEYVKCLDAASDAIRNRSYGEEWPMLKALAEMRLGRYLQADETLDGGMARYSWSIRLRMLCHENCRVIGETEKAARMIDEIGRLWESTPWRYTDADDLVSLGQAAIVVGADPKDVLEGFFDRASKNYESRPDGYLAAGQLALEKNDYQLAAEILRPASEQFPDDPEICFALATAIRSAEPEKAAALLKHSLEINPRFIPTLRQLAERQIDGEDYNAAQETIKQILEINPWHPEANALQAVIHHLDADAVAESRSRATALAYSDRNPEVDHLIGRVLSRKYRFREGAAYQRMALVADPLFLPAKTQLSQDLLRLGDEQAGWSLAEEAQRRDKYDSTLFNLLQLKDSLDKFTTRRSEHFIIRMHASEAEVYGSQVEALLESAFETITAKYGYAPEDPTTVEIFNRPDDFAVRTFGIPDVAGFLGVCFGKVITANSPASQRNNPTNWQSVLWHEFCHVITLQMTGNRIPRWLSEGISVYEERIKDSRWGQSMDPTSRRRILAGNMTPVSQLSSAFLNAESGADLNFAYYESSMVVEYIVQEHGFTALLKILRDLNSGLTINDALDRHTGGLVQLDSDFSAWLKAAAEDFAPGVRFHVEVKEGETPPDLIQIATEDPKHYTAGLRLATEYIRQEQFGEAEAKLQSLIKLFPEDASANGARRLLAEVYKRQGNVEAQTATLQAHLQRSDSDIEAALELLELQTGVQSWQEALETSRLVMAIDPLRIDALQQIHQVAANTKQNDLAVQALQGLLELNPADAARTHLQIAEIMRGSDSKAAKRHVLLALEQAPRFRAAHRLLLELSPDQEPPTALE